MSPNDVRFTPESGHVQCTRDVRYVPIADNARGALQDKEVPNSGGLLSFRRNLILLFLFNQ